MPIIDVSCEELASPTRLTLSKIENVMLWPHDEAARSAALDAAGKQAMIENAAIFTDMPLGEGAPGLLSWLASNPTPNEVRAAAVQPFADGLMSGLILNDVLGRAALWPAMAGLGRAKKKAINIYANWDWVRVPSTSTMNNIIWPRYRPVAHFWAAFLGAALDGDRVFPCRLANLDMFLGRAETLLREGIRFKPPQSTVTVLSEEDAWRPDPRAHIPAVAITWSDDRSKAA